MASIGADLDAAFKSISRASFLIVMQIVQRRFRPGDTRLALEHVDSAQSQLKALIAQVEEQP